VTNCNLAFYYKYTFDRRSPGLLIKFSLISTRKPLMQLYMGMCVMVKKWNKNSQKLQEHE